MTKNEPGNFFEDFTLSLTFDHGHPRTLGEGDAALYTALYGSRFPLNASEPFAKSIGYAGFTDLQEVFRQRLKSRWPDYGERLASLGKTADKAGTPELASWVLVARAIMNLDETITKE